MTYRVVIAPEAQAGVESSFQYILERSPKNAAVWLQQLYSQIETLENFPERCAWARERDYLKEDLRQLVFKSHRIVFLVNRVTATVHVLHVRHSRMRAIGEPVRS